MQCFMIVFLYILFVLGSEAITTHSVKGCTESVVLNCSNTEMIHVERITYYNGTDCNQNVTDLQVCDQPLTGSDTELVPYCNGKATCEEIIYYSSCPGSKAAKVDYRCIPGKDVKDMCDEIIIENTTRIFLSTPKYPSRPTFTDISPCRCSIRGSSITSIQILELVLPTADDGTKSSLEIKYGDVTYITESFRVAINKRLSTESTTAEIILNNNGINDQYLWIEVQGVSVRVSCNNYNDEKDATTSSSSSPTLTPPTTSSSSSPSSLQSLPSSSPSSGKTESSSPLITTPPPETVASQDKYTVIILAVLLSLCVLIICITSIIVLLRRKKLVWVNRRESNAYSGLDRTQRASGNDGSYQELNTMNLTPQYYNASQDTQNTNHDYQYVS